MQMNQKGKALNRGFSTAVMVKAGLLAGISIVLTRFFSLMVLLGGMPTLRVGFGSVPIMLAGMLFGPLVGGAVGVVADLVGFAINPMGTVYIPGFTVTAALFGVIPGVLFHTFKIHRRTINFNYVNAVVMGIFGAATIVIYLRGDRETASLIWVLGMAVVTVLFCVLPFIVGARYREKTGPVAFDKIAFVTSVTHVVNSVFLNTIWLAMVYEKGVLAFIPGRVLATVVSIPIYAVLLFVLGRFMKIKDV